MNLQAVIIAACLVACSAQFVDEMQIYEGQCLGENRFPCMEGGCIYHHQYCDGHVDCQDGSDESLCLHNHPNATLCNETHEYMCQDQIRCIPRVLICNNDTDCDDGSDEMNCTVTQLAPVNSTCKGFTCGDGKCISQLWVCDGTYDCSDYSDEINTDLCRHVNHRYLDSAFCNRYDQKFNLLYHLCNDSSFCLPEDMMYDGVKDCKDGSDEDASLANWHTMCAKHECFANDTACRPTRQGPSCVCRETTMNYNPVTRKCEDVNECQQDVPQCSHKCINFDGHFVCTCEEGYTLNKFGYLCFAQGPEAVLFFSTRTEIKYLKIKSKQLFIIATGLKQAHGVSYDGKFLYWSETADGHQSIVRAHLEDVKGSKQVIVGLGLEDPGDIAIDWLGGNIYFGDAERGIISACTTDGAICTTIKTQTWHPRYVTLDAKNGKMYWADWHTRPVIMSAKMDGSAAEVLVNKLQTFPTGLAVDAPNDRLYYVDKTICVLVLSTKNVYTLFEEPFHHPYSLSVFENTVYWSDWTSNTIQTKDKLHDNKAKREILLTLDSPVFGMHMYHPALMNNTVNPCNGHLCSHFCFVTSNSTHVCGCPEGMQLKNNKCEHIASYHPQYLIVGGGELFTRVQYNSLGNPETHATSFNIGRVQAMAYDSARDTLYIYDGQRRTVNYINMSDYSLGFTHTLLYNGLDNVVDMDYDYASDSLYILDAGYRTIDVVSLRTLHRAMVYKFPDEEIPIGFCVMPEYGRMLVAVVESQENDIIHIENIGLDGEGRHHILMNKLKGPHVRLKYDSLVDLVYVSDEGNGLIEFMHPEGMGREIFRELSTTITSMALTDAYVFWTDRRTSRLFWAVVHESTHRVRRINLSIFPNNTQILLQTASIVHRPSEHPCLKDPCSHICVQIPNDIPHTIPVAYKCICPLGLVKNGAKCVEAARCGYHEMYCKRSNMCFPLRSRCDGKKDCVYGEDEEDCDELLDNTSICMAHEINCNGVCISKNDANSCMPDIKTSTDNTDHHDTFVFNQCSVTQFKCHSGSVCVSRSQMCDDQPDCPDGSDEHRSHCDVLACYDSEFMCASGSCILKTWKCDGDRDCNDGSDEIDCPNMTCAPGYYQCRDRQCIEMRRRCDGRQDCFDFSDEEDCEEPVIFEVEESLPPRCADWEYACELNRSICLPPTTRCNIKIDCPGGTDEAGCEHMCGKHFLCSQQHFCIDISKVCNGQNNCEDGSDETPEACAKLNKTSKYYPIQVFPADCIDGYTCTTRQCIGWGDVCDGSAQCSDGSDEGGLCASACKTQKCPYTCQKTPTGGHCICPIGYRSDPSGCVDIDECANEFCSQGCINIHGSFICSCHYGYALRSDRRSCKAVKGNMSILYISGNTVRSISADGYGSVEYNDPEISGITHMDFNVRQNKLYVTSAESGKLIEVNGTHDVIAVTNIGHPTKVAVDWITGNVYFADNTPSDSCIRVCNVLKNRCAKLQKLPSDAKVSALIVDPSSRRMFYCVNRELESVVWSASLSGSNVTDLATFRNCTGLAVDSFKRQLYVAETGPAQIIRINYEGEMHMKILADHPHLQAPHGLAIFEDHIYYLVANTFRLSRCMMFGPKHCETYIYRVFDANTFVIRHESVQRDDLLNVCVGVECSGVCASSDKGAVCLCDDGAVAKDGKCQLLKQSELPLFNGWSRQDYARAHSASFTVVVAVLTLVVIYVTLFVYYHFVYKPKRNRASTYTEVRFQNASPAMSFNNPTVEMGIDGNANTEFVNPLQYVRNVYQSFRHNTRPIGTSGLSFSVPRSPQQDLSDTESDLDYREDKSMIGKR
ncbi:hypothetical protein K1T71_012901 [Dendrolimus kikuchii]|uniref:Uncharacterized protein n=1 Tax=Dendrolimus kikuchii TaxID=765133 RepID=A0ACC1CIN9_9NEOP|nr:hypothetical protein K1T71_012901 [Dendrolimus kikuchii]